MKTTIETKSGKITITSDYKGDKVAPWCTDEKGHPQNGNRHTVGVSFNGKRLQFDFWASLAEPEMRTDSDLIEALDCFMRDGLSGNDNTFEEFCSEFGYDEDSRKAERVYRDCQRHGKKAERVFGSDLNEIYDEISELANA